MILDLIGDDRRLGRADRIVQSVGREVTHADVVDYAVVLEFVHRADRLFERDRIVRRVDEQQVDCVELKRLKALVRRVEDRIVIPVSVVEFGRDEEVVALDVGRRYRVADRRLRPVYI